MSGARIRQKFAKKRSLHGVNEHFSQIFNAIIVPRSNRAKVSERVNKYAYRSNVPRLNSHIKRDNESNQKSVRRQLLVVGENTDNMIHIFQRDACATRHAG